MKPTAEMVERARALLVSMGLFDPSGTWDNAIAQALADEHERAMERAALIVEAKWRLAMPPPQMGDGEDAALGYAFKDTVAAIRAAAKGK